MEKRTTTISISAAIHDDILAVSGALGYNVSATVEMILREVLCEERMQKLIKERRKQMERARNEVG